MNTITKIDDDLRKEIGAWVDHKERMMSYAPELAENFARVKCTYTLVFNKPFWIKQFRLMSMPDLFNPNGPVFFFREIEKMEEVFDELVKFKSYGARYEEYTFGDLIVAGWKSLWNSGSVDDHMNKIEKEMISPGDWLNVVRDFPDCFQFYSKNNFIETFALYYARKRKKGKTVSVNEDDKKKAAELYEDVRKRLEWDLYQTDKKITKNNGKIYRRDQVPIGEATGNFYVDIYGEYWIELYMYFLHTPELTGWVRGRDIVFSEDDDLRLDDWIEDRKDEDLGKPDQNTKKKVPLLIALGALILLNS